jgi:hypothetical protein
MSVLKLPLFRRPSTESRRISSFHIFLSYNSYFRKYCKLVYTKCGYGNICYRYNVSPIPLNTHLGVENFTKVFRFVFWDVLPGSIIVYRRFRGTCCLHHQGDLIAAVHGSTSQKTNLNFLLAAVRT